MRRMICLVAIYAATVYANPAGAEIRIGWIGPLTGNAAVLGVDTIPSIQMVFDEINANGGISGESLKLVVQDDQYEAAKTVSAYNHLVHAEGVKVMFVLTYGGVIALAPRAQADGVLILDSLDCDETLAALPDSVICIAKSTEALGAVLARHMLRRGDAPPAVIYFDGDPFMGTAALAMIEELKKSNAVPAVVESYNSSTADFRSILSRVKKSPQSKSLALLGYDQVGVAAKQARELGISLPLYGLNTVTSPGFQLNAGAAADGIRGSAFIAERSAAFESYRVEFVKRMGRGPQFETSAIPSYDAARLLVSALRAAGYDKDAKTVRPDRLRDELLRTKGYKGLAGEISIDADGATRSISVQQTILRGGDFVGAESE